MSKSERQTNIEVLRVVSMLLIVVMHYIFYGLKQNPLHQYYDIKMISGLLNYLTMESLYLLSQVAVNCYVMITGYFLIDKLQYRWKGIFRIIIQTLFYSILFFVIACAIGEDAKREVLKSFLPIHQCEYWFVTTYIGLLLIAPFIALIATSLNKKQYQIMLVVLFILTFKQLYGNVYAGHRTILFFSFLFLIAGYFKLYGMPQKILKRKKLLFVGIWFILIAMATLVNLGHNYFELIGTSYDGPILFLSIITFILFTDAELDKYIFKVIAKFAPYTFGVYLIHENHFISAKLWYLLPETYTYPIMLHCVMLCLAIFATCVVIDYLREKIFNLVSIDALLTKICNKMPQL